MKAHADPEYLRDAKKMGLDVSPLSGADVAKVINQAVSLPEQLIARYGELLTKSNR